MIKRRLFFCLALTLLLGSAAAAAPGALADDQNRVAELDISVWPEYDTPTVLVILSGKLADASNQPRQVSVLVPTSAQVHVVTFSNADGSLAKEQPYETSSLGDGYTKVSFSVSSPNFWVEYYDDLLRGSPDKTMDFSFKAAAPADKVTLEVQQPLKATNWSINPPAQTTRADNGFTYSVASYSGVAAGQMLTAQVKYTKTDPGPSVAPQTSSATVPSTTPSPAPTSIWNSIYVVVALVLLGLTAVFGFLTLQRRSRRLAPVTPSARASRRGGRHPREASGGSVFCPQCGRSLGSEDLFCSKCGAPRRTV